VACASAAAALPLKEILAAPEISGHVVAAKLSWRPIMPGNARLAWRSMELGLIHTRPDSQFSMTAVGISRGDLHLPPRAEAVEFQLTRDVEREKKLKNRLVGDWLVHSVQSGDVFWSADQLDSPQPPEDFPTPNMAPCVREEPWLHFRTFDDDVAEGFCFYIAVPQDLDLRVVSRARS